jgi:lipoprotein-releasing system ATP-binding protein
VVKDVLQAQSKVVQLQAVIKAFNVGQPNELEVLHGIDLSLSQGEFSAIMGPSGSGKSTLLNIVGLLDRPTSGSLMICGEETTCMDDQTLTRLRGSTIGFVFQYHHLLGAFTALENVMMPMFASQGFFNQDLAGRAMELLESVGLKAFAGQLAGSLSGGQQQRVALARALAMRPKLLLADEPTGNLDTKSADAVFELLRTVSRTQQTAVLFVTHNAELAARCDNIIQVVDGCILHATSP